MKFFGISIILFLAWALANAQNDTWRFDLSECGKSKGCWYMPGSCDGSRSGNSLTNGSKLCHSIATWQAKSLPDGRKTLLIELDTRIDDMMNFFPGKYAALGFSYDTKMGDDFVIECVAKPTGQISAYVSFNDGAHNGRLLEASKILLSNTHGVMRDSRLTCQTTMTIDSRNDDNIPVVEKWQIFDLTNKAYTLMFVRGDAVPLTDMLQMHSLADDDLFPWISTKQINVYTDKTVLRDAKHTDIPRAIQYSLVQAHGILMLFGWWVFAAVAAFLSRYFKQSFPDTNLCGQKAWFQLHRALMIISLILQCSAFALIFIQAGDFKMCTYACMDAHDYNLMLHTYLGVACTAAALIQPFMALCRPAPTSPKRPIFNWLHWFFGSGSFLVATVAIFLSTSLGKIGLQRMFGHQADYIMAGYICAYIVCSLAFELIRYTHVQTDMPSSIPLNLLNGPHSHVPLKTIKNVSRYHTLQAAVLIFFAASAIALCGGLAYLITHNGH